MNHVHKILDDTKDTDRRLEMEKAGGKPGGVVEKPEVVMQKIHQQATCLGPVMEEILRATHGRGWSHRGLNE
ncbi:MAG: hypothetical protein ACLP0A_10085 [Verrucomicrobiia bacterium]